MRYWCVLLVSFVYLGSLSTRAQSDEHHQHGASADTPVQRPVVFLDKSPRIVQYQLKRLDNTRLLLVERQDTDPKYSPVYEAILKRPGIARQEREESIAALTKIRETNSLSLLVETIGDLNADSQSERQVARQLTALLLTLPGSDLTAASDELIQAAAGSHPLASAAGFAALMLLGKSDAIATVAAESNQSLTHSLEAVRLLETAAARNLQRERIIRALQGTDSPDVQRAALRALATTTEDTPASFAVVASLMQEPGLRPAAVRALSSLVSSDVDAALCDSILQALVTKAESISAESRTSDEFIDEMQLADALLGRLPAAKASAYRERLRAVTVRIVRIRTVLEEMRYDTTYFAVEAGRPVQVIVQNEDLMPHNMVITRYGKLQFVAEQGAQAGPEGSSGGLPYVPDSNDVLFATPLIDAGKQQRLTFTAPTEPGEYPYVCTFPRHWVRMYGVMLVVPDLDAWMQNPVIPKDPLGNTRSFVQNWTLAALTDALQTPPARDTEAGARLFAEATCSQCHKIDSKGGEVGPELTDVLTRWKGDRRGILREMLDPSYRIDPKYTVQLIVTTEGRTISGIVKAENEDSVSLLVNPEAKELTVVNRDQIEEIIPSTTSMMPKALLDKFTEEEIMQILSYICRDPADLSGELCK